MTDRESQDGQEYPAGSVGRYVRERWGAVPTRSTRRHGFPARRQAPEPPPASPSPAPAPPAAAEPSREEPSREEPSPASTPPTGDERPGGRPESALLPAATAEDPRPAVAASLRDERADRAAAAGWGEWPEAAAADWPPAEWTLVDRVPADQAPAGAERATAQVPPRQRVADQPEATSPDPAAGEPPTAPGPAEPPWPRPPADSAQAEQALPAAPSAAAGARPVGVLAAAPDPTAGSAVTPPDGSPPAEQAPPTWFDAAARPAGGSTPPSGVAAGTADGFARAAGSDAATGSAAAPFVGSADAPTPPSGLPETTPGTRGPAAAIAAGATAPSPPTSGGNADPARPASTARDARSEPAAAGRQIRPDPGPRTPPRGSGRWTDPAAVAAQEAQLARTGSERAPTDLTSARLLRPSKRPPRSGWRRLVYVLSGRLINPGESPADIRRRELTARVNRPLLGCYKIAMLSLKGGVGKTTMTATLGATFASLRGDRVIAVDANPDRGTLSQKIPLETTATVRHLLRDAQRVRRYTDVRAYTSQGPSRLEVLASEQDPAVSEAFSEDDYRRTVNLLEHFYNIVLTDCGTGLMHSAMYGVLGVADQLIIVSSGSIDGARSASATMDWLDAHGHGDLVRNAVAVINCVHRSSGGVDLDRVAEHFGARCRAVVRIPFDAHLEEGAEVDLDRLEPATRFALLELAASVADAFEGPPV